jgi:hypothetical protein
MRVKWIAATLSLAVLTFLALRISVPTALAQQPSGPPDMQTIIEKTFGPTKQVSVRDPFYNLVAFTITIPKDWFFEGTVLHGPGCTGSYYQSIAYRAYSPDGAYGVQATPRLDYYYWEEQNAQPPGPACKFFAPMSSADYAAMFAYRTRPKAQIDRNEPVLDAQQIREAVAKGNEQSEASARSMNMPPQHVDADFTRTRIHFEWQGMQQEEWLRVEMVYRDYPKSVFIYNGGPHPGHQAWVHFLGVTTNVYGRRAPRGKLDQFDPALSAIISSLRRTDEFVQATNARQQVLSNAIIHSIQTQTMINAQNSKAFMDSMTRQHQAFMADQNRRFETSQQIAAAQSNRQDQQARNFIGQMNESTARTRDYQDILLDQQYYVNNQTGETATVSGRMNHAFANGPLSSNATSIVQTDSNFNPNGPLGYDWNELTPIHH